VPPLLSRNLRPSPEGRPASELSAGRKNSRPDQCRVHPLVPGEPSRLSLKAPRAPPGVEGQAPQVGARPTDEGAATAPCRSISFEAVASSDRAARTAASRSSTTHRARPALASPRAGSGPLTFVSSIVEIRWRLHAICQRAKPRPPLLPITVPDLFDLTGLARSSPRPAFRHASFAVRQCSTQREPSLVLPSSPQNVPQPL
jgi:hypothetical protein